MIGFFDISSGSSQIYDSKEVPPLASGQVGNAHRRYELVPVWLVLLAPPLIAAREAVDIDLID